MALAGNNQSGEGTPQESAAKQQGKTGALADNSALKPDKYQQARQRTPGGENSELCAQWTAALAAKKDNDLLYDVNLIAAASAVLSFVSVLLVLIALRQTNASLRLAQKDRANATRRALSQSEETAEALQHAQTSAMAMSKVAEVTIENAAQIRESVSQQRTMGRMQMRPFISVLIGNAEWQDDFHNFAAYPVLQNTGIRQPKT